MNQISKFPPLSLAKRKKSFFFMGILPISVLLLVVNQPTEQVGRPVHLVDLTVRLRAQPHLAARQFVLCVIAAVD